MICCDKISVIKKEDFPANPPQVDDRDFPGSDSKHFQPQALLREIILSSHSEIETLVKLHIIFNSQSWFQWLCFELCLAPLKNLTVLQTNSWLAVTGQEKLPVAGGQAVLVSIV